MWQHLKTDLAQTHKPTLILLGIGLFFLFGVAPLWSLMLGFATLSGWRAALIWALAFVASAALASTGLSVLFFSETSLPIALQALAYMDVAGQIGFLLAAGLTAFMMLRRRPPWHVATRGRMALALALLGLPSLVEQFRTLYSGFSASAFANSFGQEWEVNAVGIGLFVALAAAVSTALVLLGEALHRGLRSHPDKQTALWYALALAQGVGTVVAASTAALAVAAGALWSFGH